MSVQVEKLEKNMAKLTIEVSAEDFNKAIEKAYQKNKGSFNVAGFRKGKVPRKMIEKMYGKEVFYEEAMNSLLPGEYTKAFDEVNEELKIMSQPEIGVEQVEAGKPFIFTALVATRPEVELGLYKGVEVTRRPVEVTPEDVDAALEKEREKNSRSVAIVDRPVQNNDRISLDFDGYVDGEQFEGGKADDYPLIIGSGSFIPGFEEQLIGAEIGVPIDVNVTFPEDYSAENLKGKEAVFKCLVHSISEKQLPELDDEFASEVSDYETLAEWKEALVKELGLEKLESVRKMKTDEAVAAAVKNATIEVPQMIIDTEAQSLLNDFAQQMSAQGISMEQYMQITGADQAQMLEQMKPDAENRIRTRLTLDAIVKAEDIQVTDEKVDEQLQKMADMYKMELEEIKKVMGALDDDRIRQDIAVEMAVDLIADNAIEVEKTEEPVEEKEETEE